MKKLVVGGVIAAVIGAALVTFGAIHTTMFVVGTESSCGVGCNFGSAQEIQIAYYLYPFWSPPNWNNVDYYATSCAVHAGWYTPINPAPSCLPPPISYSTNYVPNYAGVPLVLAGILIAGVSRRGFRSGAIAATPETSPDALTVL